MQNFFQNAMSVTRNLNLLESGLIKLYIISVTIIFSIFFPVLLSLDLSFYIFMFVIFFIISLSILINKEGNVLKKIFGNINKYRVFKNYNMFDFGIFKVTLASFGLLLVKVYPVFLTYDLGIYLTIFGFGAGYILSKIFNYK